MLEKIVHKTGEFCLEIELLITIAIKEIAWICKLVVIKVFGVVTFKEEKYRKWTLE